MTQFPSKSVKPQVFIDPAMLVPSLLEVKKPHVMMVHAYPEIMTASYIKQVQGKVIKYHLICDGCKNLAASNINLFRSLPVLPDGRPTKCEICTIRYPFNGTVNYGTRQ